MGLRSFFRRTRNSADRILPAAADRAGIPPEQLAELEQARAELAQAAEVAGVTAFHACTRNGTSWEENPAVVRALAAALRDCRADEAAPDGPGSVDR